MNTNTHMQSKLTTVLITLCALAVLSGIFWMYQIANATTIGTNISTSGTVTTNGITSSGNANFTMGATNRLLIDAATTDTTVTAGALDLNVDAGAASVTAQDTTFNVNGDYLGFGQKINLASGANLGASTWQYGQAIYIGGRSTGASSTGQYIGSAVFPQTSTNNASGYIGYLAAFDSSYTTALGGTGLDAIGSGNVNAFSANIKKTSAGGYMRGIEINLTNQTAAATGVYGVDMTLDVSGNPGDNKGILIQENGSSGTLQDGVKVNGDVTDGIDVSATNIVNAINIGTNTILGNGSSTIDLNNSGTTTLTITNSAAAVATLDVEGDITASGGFRNVAGVWRALNVAANLTNSQLDLETGSPGLYLITLPFAGSVVGVCVTSTNNRTAGTLTVQPTVAGTGVPGLTAVLDATNTTTKCSTIAKDTTGATFNTTGNTIGAIVSTSSDWAPTTADIVVTVVVEF